jgi:spore maturation protein CgeB
MHIYAYRVEGLNENFYFDYMINGLRKIGHKVTIRPKQVLTSRDEAKHIEILNIDFILFYGFGFMSHLKGQGQIEFLPEVANKPYVVHWCDNPVRYLSHLKELKCTEYTFFMCDSELTQKMKDFGFRKSYYLPTCFDPEIQYPRPSVPVFKSDTSFAGSVFKYETLRKNRSGLSIHQNQILDSLVREQKPGVYQDYITYLEIEGIDPHGGHFERMAFCNLMEQKHFLRMGLFEKVASIAELHIWGQGDWETNHPNIINNRNLNQHTELPYLYSNTKINTTVELLPASVHQRIMEVAGCGGFIIGEDKEDMNNCFTDYVVWKDYDDLQAKVKHFLANDNERVRVANKMRDEAMDRHTNSIRASELIEQWRVG